MLLKATRDSHVESPDKCAPIIHHINSKLCSFVLYILHYLFMVRLFKYFVLVFA
jgi:hypothetical protein